MPESLRALRYLLLPLLVLGALYNYLPQLDRFNAPWEELLPTMPYLLGGLIALLGWHFNSARSLLACLLLLLTDLCLRNPSLNPLYQQALLILLPLNLALIAWYPERGLLSLSTFLRLILIAAQLISLGLLISYEPQQLAGLLNLQIKQLPATPSPPLALIALILSCLAILLRLLRRQDRLDALLLISAATTWLILFKDPVSTREISLLSSTLLALWLIGLFRHSHRMAYLDDLTGLPGRRALNEHLARLGKRHCLAMLDIDHFKKFNDTHGHDAGDQVLKLVATKIGRVRLGKAYRYGGEEFCVVFAGRTLEQTLEPLEELREIIATSRLQLRSEQRPKSNVQGKQQRQVKHSKKGAIAVTISIGVAENRDKSDTLKAADKALYRAKAQGRNQVCY